MRIDRQKVFDKYDGHCAYCGKELDTIKNMQVDHILPKCCWNFEYDKDINRFENLNPSCRRCNHYKRAELLEDFRRSIMTIQERLMKIYIFKVAVDFGIVKIKPFDGVFYFEKSKKQ